MSSDVGWTVTVLLSVATASTPHLTTTPTMSPASTLASTFAPTPSPYLISIPNLTSVSATCPAFTLGPSLFLLHLLLPFLILLLLLLCIMLLLLIQFFLQFRLLFLLCFLLLNYTPAPTSAALYEPLVGLSLSRCRSDNRCIVDICLSDTSEMGDVGHWR